MKCATLGPAGYFPVAPGTVGSAIGVAVWWLGLSRLPLMGQAVIIIGLAGLAVFSAYRAEAALGHDAHPIVIDELVGQILALMLQPKVWWAMLASFVLFRLFDIWKPFPIGVSQRLPGGWGVVVDDVLAGIYAGVLALIVVRVVTGGR